MSWSNNPGQGSSALSSEASRTLSFSIDMITYITFLANILNTLFAVADETIVVLLLGARTQSQGLFSGA